MTLPTAALRVIRPRSVEEAVAAHAGDPHNRFLAGGTDLVVNMRHGIARPERLIDLSGIDEMRACEAGPDGLTIGAGVSIAALAANAVARAQYRALAQAAESIAGPGHRRMGTVGGNLCLDTRCLYYNQSEWWRNANGYCLKHRGDTCHVAPQGQRCHAAYTGDLAPALLALDATVEIAGTKRSRRIALNELYVEDGKAHLALAEGELITAVHLPPSAPPSVYGKIRVRGAMDYPLAGVAVVLAARGKAIDTLRIALTGTNSRPILIAGTERWSGKPFNDDVVNDIGRLVQKQVQPMRTTMASANYRRVAAAALAQRLARTLFEESAAR